MALLPNALQGTHNLFFAILPPQLLLMGADVYSFGFFKMAGGLEQGYFGGKIVAFLNPENPSLCRLVLPFPILEGMSGSPILTYHNGPKLVGIAQGNQESRIQAHSILDYSDEKVAIREEIHRVVEFGIAYHCAAVQQFLLETSIHGFAVSDGK